MATDGDHVYDCVQCDVPVRILSSGTGALRCRCPKCGLEIQFNPRQFADSNGAQWGVHRPWPTEPIAEVPHAMRDADLPF